MAIGTQHFKYFSSFGQIFASALVILACASCGGDNNSSRTAQGQDDDSAAETTKGPGIIAIPDGTYNVFGPACYSTGFTPVYTELSQAVSMHDYDYIAIRTKTILGDRWTAVYSDDDCSLTITGKIAVNADGIYKETKERHHTWSPEACRFTASYTPPDQAAG